MSEVNQQEFRQPILQFLQGDTDVFEGNIIIGFAMVVEVMDQEGRKDLMVVTSDASGTPQSWYMRRAMSLALEDESEVDDPDEAEDGPDGED